jgi:glutamine amidotransferase
MITIVDYGLGNISAFVNVYKRLNIKVAIAKTADDLKTSSKVILPGVGAFDHAMKLLEQAGMRGTLDQLALGERIPILGVCVGMQILAHSSEEGNSLGLGWVKGRVRGFSSLALRSRPPLPHMGWNDVRSVSSNKLFDQLESEARFYFLHSYFFHCDRDEDVLATSSYGVDFSCALNLDNIYGVQFHPEKSHHYGTRLLKNFAEL